MTCGWQTLRGKFLASKKWSGPWGGVASVVGVLGWLDGRLGVQLGGRHQRVDFPGGRLGVRDDRLGVLISDVRLGVFISAVHVQSWFEAAGVEFTHGHLRHLECVSRARVEAAQTTLNLSLSPCVKNSLQTVSKGVVFGYG